MARYLDPKADLTFKKVFGQHKNLVKSLLNQLLPLPEDMKIESVEYLTNENIPDTPAKKFSIVDVKCQDDKGRFFIVEMQMFWTKSFFSRTLFNTSSLYSKQLEKGDAFEQLHSVYSLCLLNDIAFPEYEDYLHTYKFTNQNHTENTIDDMVMVFVELPKFEALTRTEEKLKKLWLRFLTEIKDNCTEVAQELYNDKEVSQALEILEESAFTDAEKATYSKFWLEISTEKSVFIDAIEIGREEEKLKNAKAMKAEGLDINLISRITGLSIDEIEKLE